MQEAFSKEQFRDAFEVTTKVKNKLAPFISKLKEQNIMWIVQSLEELYRLFFDEKVPVHLKFNSIFGLKFMFDTGDVILINLIEIYFLPKILQIASFEVNVSTEKRGTSYFIAQGYPKDTADIQKFGYNFVRMASEFVTAAAVVKPWKLFESQELKQPSEYDLACKKLKDSGFKPYPTPVYYKQGMAQTIRGIFQKNLQDMDQQVDSYIGYFITIFKQFIINDKPIAKILHPHKLIEYGDTYITSEIVTVCEEQFSNPSLKHKKNALYLLNELIIWGDIESAHLINCTSFLDEVVKEIASPEVGSRTLNRGKHLFKKYKENQVLKQEFYTQMLKNIQFWSLCYPKALKVKGRESKIKHIYDELRNKLQIQFPEDSQLREKKGVFDQASEKHKKRNQRLLKELKQIDPDLEPLLASIGSVPSAPSIPSGILEKPSSPKKAQSSRKIEEATPSGNDYDRLKKDILDVNACIDTLCDSQARADAKIDRIKKFSKQFQSSIEQADLTGEQFDQIFNKSYELTERIAKILPHLQRYHSRKITFSELNNLLHGKSVSPPKDSAIRPVEKKETQKKKEYVESEGQLPVIDSPHLKSSKIENIGRNQQTSLLNSKQQKKPVPSLKSLEELTPIKGIKEQFQEHQKFNDSKDMSSLPQNSRKSVVRESPQNLVKPESKKYFEQKNVSTEPVSHHIIGSSKTSLKVERTEKETKQKEVKQKEDPVANMFKQIIQHESPVAKAQPKVETTSKQNILNELQEEVENNIGIHVPKSLKNVNGSYKLRQEVEKEPSIKEKPLIPSRQNILKESRDSKLSSKVKFQESKWSIPQNLNLDDQNDIIIAPQVNPLEISYHDLKSTDEAFRPTHELSFKKCFEEDKYLLGGDRTSKKFRLANDTFNLVRRSDSSKRQSRAKESTISIPSLLNERDKKYEEELRYLEDKKNRRITELQSKIKILENTGEAMKQRLVQQERQIKTIKASSEVDNSRVKRNSLLDDQEVIFKAKLASVQNKSIRDRTLFQESRKDPRYLDPLGKLINTRKYNGYFNQFSSQKQKKNLLKSKELLLKTDEIQFGCMSRRQAQQLIITFYVTPAVDLDGLVTRIVENDSNLRISVEPKNIPSIRKGKQEKVVVTVSVLDIPYYLPQIQFTYNLEHRISNQQFLVPCTFHKFVHLAPTDQKEIQRHFERQDKILRGQEVPYSKKLLKNITNLSDYFAGGVLMKSGQPNRNGQIEFGGKAVWNQQLFWLRIMVRPNQFLYVQVVSENESLLPEFYVAIITNLLMKNIDLKQM